MKPEVQAGPERDAAIALLAACGLPTADLSGEQMPHFFYCGSARNPAGIVGVEILGGEALLRSLAVSETKRGAGIGAALVAGAEDFARSRGVRTVYLLTTTAERFFSRRGYLPAARSEAPESVRNTHEFAALCPDSSTFMFKPL